MASWQSNSSERGETEPEGESSEKPALFGKYRRATSDGDGTPTSMASMWGFEDEDARRAARRKKFWAQSSAQPEHEDEEPWLRFRQDEGEPQAAEPVAAYEPEPRAPERAAGSRESGWRSFLGPATAEETAPSFEDEQVAITPPVTLVVAGRDVPWMEVTLDLRVAAAFCTRLAERWQGIEPTVTDVVIRALGLALMREEALGKGQSLALLDPGAEALSGVLLASPAVTPFRTMVSAIANERPVPIGAAPVTFVDYGVLTIERARPRLREGQLFAAALGMRTYSPVQNGESFLWTPVANMTIAYDGEVLSDAVAARIASRVRGLVTSPQQLLKGEDRPALDLTA